ncbi:unnamed protein product, partial [marine sediment metagenome]
MSISTAQDAYMLFVDATHGFKYINALSAVQSLDSFFIEDATVPDSMVTTRNHA